MNTDKSFADPFLDYVSQDIALDEETKSLISANCSLVQFGKGEPMLVAGNICQHVYFMVSGEGVSYFTDSGGKTTTWFFHFNSPESTAKNLFAVDYKSFLSGEKSNLSLEALSPVTAVRFSIEGIRQMMDRSRTFERWMRMLNEKVYIQTYDRITTLLTLSATDRYKKFLADEPYLLNMFSNYLIATYLHVTPQSLSRIRKNMGS